MALRILTLVFIASVSCLSLAVPSASQPVVVDNGYTCPPGFFPLKDYSSGSNSPEYCQVDPCYGNPGPCGAGNQCTVKVNGISGKTFLESVCTCNAPSVVSHVVYKDSCYVPGTERCNPNPCKNGGTCQAVTDFNGVPGTFQCTCPTNFQGVTCELPYPSPAPTLVNGNPTPVPPPAPSPNPPPVISGDQGLCGQNGAAAAFPQRCWFNSDPRGRYVCCDAQGCDGFNADNLTPHCKNYGYVPPNYGESQGTTAPPPSPPQGDQGVCGKPGDAGAFPTRCWFNNDPLGRYVCCDGQGCDGFNADNLTPHCKNYGYVPPNFGRTSTPSPPTGPPSAGSQGVCGTGAASAFPTRCWYNNDPQGRYVCCDNDGCNGFYPDNLFPKCKSNGYVPPSL